MGTRQGHLQATPDADSVDGGDGRHGHRLHIHEDGLAESDLDFGFVQIFQVCDLVDVGAGDERARLTAAEDQRLDPTLTTRSSGLIERFGEPPHDGFAQNVHRAIRIVEGDPTQFVRVDPE